ncbi:MAG: hypothetical protein HFG62_08315 [Lachnospiraceae bacterium]|nr:hypothetical protein [Lachnospiraceae bacterium]
MFKKFKRNRRVLSDFLRHRKEPVIIYPMGEYGLKFKLLLNHLFGVNEAWILDREISQVNGQVKTIDFLDELDDVNQYVYLLTTYSVQMPVIYKNLIEKGVDERNIINVTVEREWIVEDSILYVLNQYPVKSLLDGSDYFVRRNYISRQLYSSLRRAYMELDMEVYSRMGEVAYPFPVYQSIYHGQDAENRRYDMLLYVMDGMEGEDMERLFERYKKRCKYMVFVGETDSACLIRQCERICYSYIDIYIYINDSF